MPFVASGGESAKEQGPRYRPPEKKKQKTDNIHVFEDFFKDRKSTALAVVEKTSPLPSTSACTSTPVSTTALVPSPSDTPQELTPIHTKDYPPAAGSLLGSWFLAPYSAHRLELEPWRIGLDVLDNAVHICSGWTPPAPSPFLQHFPGHRIMEKKFASKFVIIVHGDGSAT